MVHLRLVEVETTVSIVAAEVALGVFVVEKMGHVWLVEVNVVREFVQVVKAVRYARGNSETSHL